MNNITKTQLNTAFIAFASGVIISAFVLHFKCKEDAEHLMLKNIYKIHVLQDELNRSKHDM